VASEALRVTRGAAGVDCWLVRELVGAPGLTGIIGNLPPGADARLLVGACRELRDLGADRVVGPMEGSTWGRYRLALPGSDTAPFTGEPDGAEQIPTWEEAGFEPFAYYQSRSVRLPVRRPGSELLAERMRAAGIRVHEPVPTELGFRLPEMFAVGLRAFAGAFLYRPITFNEFLQVQGGGNAADPLVLLAESQGGLLGFVYAYPDSSDPSRIVMKTLAADPASPRGTGAFLSDELHRVAAARGFQTGIHALMRDDNQSIRLSRRYGSGPLRRYVLMRWLRP
jgi:hypothetical protein